MTIKVGDRVEAIDEDFSGKVIAIEDSVIHVEDSDGFVVEYQIDEIMPILNMDAVDEALYRTDFNSIKREKRQPISKKTSKIRPKQQQKAHFIVDLHIHQLTDSTKGMTNFDMLNLQLDAARQQLEFAIRRRIPKMVFIHGVGEGVLRQELYTFLRRYNNVDFYEADYKTYGLGATEVRIFQNVKP